MEGFNLERRGLFDGLKVPVTGNAVLLGALGILVYWLGIIFMEELFDLPGDGVCRLFQAMLGNLSTALGWPGQVLARLGGWTVRWTSYPGWVWIAFAFWTIACWAFFSAAISRIAAMKLAREEGLELRDALRFGGKKFLSNLGAVAFVLVIIGFFYLVTNATIAGGLARILPFGIGNVLLGLLFVLVLVSSFLIVLVGALGVVGCNLASSAIATEVSDAFDGVSRAWDYVVARPWNLILTWLATAVYIGVVLLLGNLLLDVSVRSLSVGWWGLGEAPRQVEIPEALNGPLDLPRSLKVAYLPGKAEFIYHRVIGKRFRPDQSGHIYFRQGIECAIERYSKDTGELPSTLRDLIYQPHRDGKALQNWGGKAGLPYLLMDEPPLDRWNRQYCYRAPGRGGKPYDVFSSGADGVMSSEDDVVGIPPDGIAVGYGPEIDIAPLTESSLSFAARGVSIWQNVARLLLFGYLVAYFFCSQTTVYFLLRREVEGEDYTEIVLEEDLEDDGDVEFPGGATAPPAPAPTPALPTTTPPPAAPPAGAPEKAPDDKPLP